MSSQKCLAVSDGWNTGPCGPAPCAGECRGEKLQCDACSAPERVVYAVLVSEDLEYLCHDCARELHAEVRVIL